MTFKEFWPLYLRAHRLPGTRGLHYFATAFGIVAAIEAISTGQPLIFVLGIAVSYAIAIAAHWFVECNQPLITVNALWGAVADLRMCWLAATGRMGYELALHGIVQPTPARMGTGQRGHRPVHSAHTRYLLLGGSIAGVAAGFTDLSDLAEPMERLALPVVQLGVPILAFSSALVAAGGAMLAARHGSRLLLDEAPSGAVLGTPFLNLGTAAWPAGERSLRHACLALLAFGLIAFILAELAEDGLPHSIHLAGGFSILAMLLFASAIVTRQYGIARSGAGGAVPFVRPRAAPSTFGPQTRGLRVDGRVHLVDMMEDLLSAGSRQAILKATLDAADLRLGERFVDVGCGTGELAMMAARIVSSGSRPGTGEAIGIDATPGMIEIARQRAGRADGAVRFELGVAEALPLPNGTVQAVASTFFFHHLPTEVKREAIREMWRVLAPGGRLVIADYGWARGFVGLIASFPMRFNFHEYVRPQLNGELERIIAEEGLPEPQNTRVFLGYIRVLCIAKDGIRAT